MRKVNKILKLLLICSAVLAGTFSNAYCRTYFVKNSGSDSATGLDDSNAWRTIGKVNSVNFANGDIIQFRRGDTFDDSVLNLNAINSPGTKTITIKDYGTGALPWVGGKSKYIIIDHPGLSLIIQNINVDSQEFESDYAAIYLRDLKNITIDGVEADGSVGHVSRNRRAISIRNPTGHVEIKNCKIEHWGPSTLWNTPPTPSGKIDHEGIYIGNMTSGTLSIHDNTIEDIEADCIQMENVRIATKVYNNKLWNGGENALDLKGCRYISVYNNTMGRDATFTGVSGSSYTEGSSTQPIIQVMDWKTGGASEDIEIYQNTIGPTDLVNFRITSSHGYVPHNISFHNNYCKAAKFHFFTFVSPKSVEIKDNIFDGLKANGQFIYDQNSNATLYERNHFYSESDTGNPEYGLIRLNDSNASFRDNSFDVNEGSKPIVYIDSSSNPTLKNNCYYNKSDNPGPHIYWKGTEYYSAEQNEWVDAGHEGDAFNEVQCRAIDSGSQSFTLVPPKNLKISVN